MFRWIVIISLILLEISFSQTIIDKENSRSMQKPLFGEPSKTLMNVNNFSFWLRNDGWMGRNPITSRTGGIYPRGTGSVLYQDGFLWGGYKHDGSGDPPLHVGGMYYRIGTVPGRIISPNHAQNPLDPEVRIYRIRRDWQTMSDSLLRLDASEWFHVHSSEVTPTQMIQIRNQYARDWQEWPADIGAPFYDDNGNGIYEPHLGEAPGLRGADQVVWFVCNDLNPDYTQWVAASNPLGIEIQVTYWGYNLSGVMGETIFSRYLVTNKTILPIDSMYIGKFVDPDIGYDYGNDFIGCDSVFDYAFSYNSIPTDNPFTLLGLNPPAVGYVLLDGYYHRNIVSEKRATNKLSYISAKIRPSSFTYFYPYFQFDEWHVLYERTLVYYNCLKGNTQTDDTLNTASYVHMSGPYTGNPTRFPLNGDPVTGLGDIDGQGQNQPSGDRRFLLSSGPFTFMPGDSLVLTYAIVGGIDLQGDNISSLARLQTNLQQVGHSYRKGILYPRTTAVSWKINDTRMQHAFTCEFFDMPDLLSAELLFYPEQGNAPEFSLDLYNDGQHGDSLAGDNIWGNSLELDNSQYPHAADAILTRSAGTDTLPGVFQKLRFRPAPELVKWRVSWENGKQDQKVNYNERVFLAFDVKNNDQINPVKRLNIRHYQSETSIQRIENAYPIEGAATAGEAGFYVDITAPHSGESTTFDMSLMFDGHSVKKTYSYPIIPWEPDTLWKTELPVEVINGFSENVEVLIADPALLTGHDYLITFFKITPDSLLWRIIDLSLPRIIADSLPLVPETTVYNHPVINGIMYKVYKIDNAIKNFEVVANAAGVIDPSEIGCFGFNNNGFPFLYNALYDFGTDRPDAARQQVNQSTWGFHTYMTPENDATFEYFLGQVFPQGDLSLLNWQDYEMRFTAEPNYAVWNFGDSGLYQVPFELWNTGEGTLDDPSDDYRMIPWIRNIFPDSGSGGNEFNLIREDHIVSSGENDPYTDAVYWHNPLDTSPGEAGYQQFVADAQAGMYLFDSPGVMDATVLVNWNGGDVFDPHFPANVDTVMPELGTIFRITSVKPSRAGDRLLVRAPQPRPDILYDWPKTFVVHQNYPNPFNSQTVIAFELPVNGPVSLEIYNILGQRVKTLLDNRHYNRGWQQVRWDGFNDRGVPVSSGIYIFRMLSGNQNVIKKMVVVR